MNKNQKSCPEGRVLVAVLLLAAVSVPAQNADFIEQWNSAASTNFTLSTPNNSSVIPNVTDTAASDDKSLRLTVPANIVAGAGRGPEVETKASYRFGTFSARLKSVDTRGQPDAGIITGLFTYFNNGTDQTGDGLPDNSEIDFEWLGAEPQSVYLTMWTDYRASDERHKRVTRKINLATGTIEFCNFTESFSGPEVKLTGNENLPSTVQAIPGYNSATTYYEYGFSWTASRVTWWIVLPGGTKSILWDYQGPAARIPGRSSTFMINAWHSDNWPPETRPTAVRPPTAPVSMFVDWVQYSAPGSTVVHRGLAENAVVRYKRPDPGCSIVADILGRQIEPASSAAPALLVTPARTAGILRLP
jgi:hypothetical protein